VLPFDRAELASLLDCAKALQGVARGDAANKSPEPESACARAGQLTTATVRGSAECEHDAATHGSVRRSLREEIGRWQGGSGNEDLAEKLGIEASCWRCRGPVIRDKVSGGCRAGAGSRAGPATSPPEAAG